MGTHEETNEADIQSVEIQVEKFLNSKNIDMDLTNVDSCYLLPKRKISEGRDNETRAVMLRFISRKYKVALLKQGKNLKGSNVFINENLNKTNATIAWKARQLKKGQKLQNTWTANCKVYIKPNGSSENIRPVLIRALEELEKYE
ncbi:hypothetical protein AAFF_G00148370 [Aldrovandia affinis]|uniref:Uncharacterized protein n=1 Tax=Aldrovandia affinis TaxID=143900 RepID=A0AAD7R170_9TELE|nr:hypothetical protein AAFF_G00148370 [Aldrovandia affinis]